MTGFDFKALPKQFCFDGEPVSVQPLGNGNINKSYYLECDNGCLVSRYVIQQLNTDVFKNPTDLMNNTLKVCNHLREKIILENGDLKYEMMEMVPVTSGGYLYTDHSNAVYRAYHYIDNVTTYQKAETPHVAYHAAYTFGVFHRRLSDFDPTMLKETISDFHNTPLRAKRLLSAIEKDSCNRAVEVKSLIDFATSRIGCADILVKALENKKIPIRVVHNDTKINNVLFRTATNIGCCVIDLDTVMPGTILYDFGDMVRSGASTSEEDDTRLDLVGLDMTNFKNFVKGFLDASNGSLTSQEVDLLAMSCRVITYELAIRFLTDYLEGDVYFTIRREGHNAQRAANQLKLLSDMEIKYEQMLSVVQLLCK